MAFTNLIHSLHIVQMDLERRSDIASGHTATRSPLLGFCYLRPNGDPGSILGPQWLLVGRGLCAQRRGRESSHRDLGRELGTLEKPWIL